MTTETEEKTSESTAEEGDGESDDDSGQYLAERRCCVSLYGPSQE